ncbi:MAG: hypothetical protein ACFB9N_15185 [Geitlerinemataceae cyanobacterium]
MSELPMSELPMSELPNSAPVRPAPAHLDRSRSSQSRFEPRFEPAAIEREPLPISKLPPLRPPTEGFRALSAKLSWSDISKSKLDRAEETPVGRDDLRDVFSSEILTAAPSEPPNHADVVPVVSAAPAASSVPARRPRRARSQFPSAIAVYAGVLGVGLAAAFHVAGSGPVFTGDRAPLRNSWCVGSVRPGATLTPEAVSQLPEAVGRARSEVVQSMGEPYCTLPKMAVRYGVLVERDLYLTADNSRVVLSYEDGVLLGAGIETATEIGVARQASVGAASGEPHAEIPSNPAAPAPLNSGPPQAPAPDGARDPNRLREVKVQQYWGVQIGDDVGSASVSGSLGDISLAYSGRVLAPLDGRVEEDFVTIVGERLLPNEPGCVLFSSPQLPAYLVKACGLVQRYLGEVRAGEPIGRTNSMLHVSLLSRRRDGAANEAEWVYVSPSPEFLSLAIESEN